jgi:hypothetical protein
MNILSYLSALRVGQKITLVAVTLAVPLAVLAYLLLANLGEQSTFIKKELAGLEYLQSLRKVQELVPAHRGYTELAAENTADAQKNLDATTAAIQDAFVEIESIDQRANRLLETSGKWSELRNKWADLKARKFTTKDSFTAHNKFLEQVADLAGHIGDKSNLILDPVNLTVFPTWPRASPNFAGASSCTMRTRNFRKKNAAISITARDWSRKPAN